MPLVHIVLFEFKPTIERSVIQDVRQLLSLRGRLRGPEIARLYCFLTCDPSRITFADREYVGVQKDASFEA